MKLDAIDNIKVPIKVVIGETQIDVKDLAQLSIGSIVMLDSLAGEPVDVEASGNRIARAEVVVIDEKFGVRITEILENKEE